LLFAALGCSLGCSSSDGSEPASTRDPKTGLLRCPADPAQQTSEPCVDKEGAVLCKADSGFPGDELRICPPDPTKGMVLHYGPKNYDDAADVAKFILPAGGENENCVIAHTPNTEDVYVRNYHGRMRPNSHHLIVTTMASEVPDSNGPIACRIQENVGTRWLLGSQDPQIDLSITGSEIPPEKGEPDYGLGQKIKANTPVRIDMHYINSTSQDILKEGWVYLEYVDESEIVNLVDMITFFQGAINVPPRGSSETAKGACSVPSPRYVGLMTGHFHQNGTRFSVWKRDKAGVETLIYETYDWEDPGNLWYRDKSRNPLPDPDTLSHGGWTGFLTVEPGESLVYQCAYKNPTDQTITLGEMGSDQMCNVFGMYYPSDGNVWGCVCLGDQCS
jgi:hypothetical protein